MSGVWVMKDGVVQQVEGDEAERLLKEAGARQLKDAEARRLLEKQSLTAAGGKRLLHIPSGQVVLSLAELEEWLVDLRWERNDNEDDKELVHFYKPGDHQLGPITIPRDFSHLSSDNIRDIALKTRGTFGIAHS
uniref:Uncharacterized protein n=1 Tax=Avena sativa TaxID=4498 RepID=A0ACD5YCE9_AVESA